MLPHLWGHTINKQSFPLQRFCCMRVFPSNMENREELRLTHPWNQKQKYNRVMEQCWRGYPQGKSEEGLCYLSTRSWIIIIGKKLAKVMDTVLPLCLGRWSEHKHTSKSRAVAWRLAFYFNFNFNASTCYSCIRNTLLSHSTRDLCWLRYKGLCHWKKLYVWHPIWGQTKKQIL